MANVYQQKALTRKLTYFVLILALFSAALVHRRFVVEPQAFALQLRETARGEVKLTSSAVRLLLAGPRGLVVTLLWDQAIKAQEKHQWSELKLIVDSITTLQPYFITPWLFQSWNLSFNVAVEHDLPRDKYFYVSEGIKLLAEGERRNQGSDETQVGADKISFPANPELRHQVGFFYQLKIGNSDEKNTMRCLLDLSCIDPLKREHESFWVNSETGRQIDETKFNAFCLENPRLIRRLREQLHYDTRMKIVRFLKENKDVPSRFKGSNKPDANVSDLLDPRDQFPNFPPVMDPKWYPDATKYDLGLNTLGADKQGETLDVFLVGRTWYLYSQRPLPPATTKLGPIDAAIDTTKYRKPKQLAMSIFRTYPCRAQMFMAENLEAEGWFDDQGWSIPAWGDPQRGSVESEPPIVGRESKFQAIQAWRTTYDMYLNMGIENGLYLSPKTQDELQKQAQFYRDTKKVKDGERGSLRPDEMTGELGESFTAHNRLFWSKHYRGLTNYDAHMAQSEAEKDPFTIHARKVFYQAERARRFERAPEQAILLYEETWPHWIYICVKYPKFANVQVLQEDIFEMEMWYMKLMQKQKDSLFRAVLLGMAQMSTWPHPLWEDLMDPADSVRILPVRRIRGPLDEIQYYDGPQAEELRVFLQAWILGASHFRGPVFIPPELTMLDPVQQRFMLVRSTLRFITDIPPDWKTLVEEDTVNSVRARLGITK